MTRPSYCDDWDLNRETPNAQGKVVNPKTGRKIKLNAGVSKALDKDCNRKASSKPSKKKSPKTSSKPSKKKSPKASSKPSKKKSKRKAKVAKAPKKPLTKEQEKKKAERKAKAIKAAERKQARVDKEALLASKRSDYKGKVVGDNKNLLNKRVQEPAIASMIGNLLAPSYPMEKHYHEDYILAARIIIVLPDRNDLGNLWTNEWEKRNMKNLITKWTNAEGTVGGNPEKTIQLVSEGMTNYWNHKPNLIKIRRVGELEIFGNKILQIPVLLKRIPTDAGAIALGGFIYNDWRAKHISISYLNRKEVGTVEIKSIGRPIPAWTNNGTNWPAVRVTRKDKLHKGKVTNLEDYIQEEYPDLHYAMRNQKPKYTGGKRKSKKSVKKVKKSKKKVKKSTTNGMVDGKFDVFSWVVPEYYLKSNVEARRVEAEAKKAARKAKNAKKTIRVHKGINQSTGRLKKGYGYSGKKLKSGLKEIVKKAKKVKAPATDYSQFHKLGTHLSF